MRGMVGHQGVDILAPADAGVTLSISEDGETAADNARMEAQAYAEATALAYASVQLWMTTPTLRRRGIPTHHPLLEHAAARLAEEQQDDGRWESKDGPGQDVHATLEALRSWRGGRVWDVGIP